MITLEGRVLRVIKGTRTERETGVVTERVQVEILHVSKGKSSVVLLTIDPGCIGVWEKVAGTTEKFGELVELEVVPYAIAGRDGEILAGLTCADKKALPLTKRSLKVA